MSFAETELVINDVPTTYGFLRETAEGTLNDIPGLVDDIRAGTVRDNAEAVVGLVYVVSALLDELEKVHDAGTASAE